MFFILALVLIVIIISGSCLLLLLLLLLELFCLLLLFLLQLLSFMLLLLLSSSLGISFGLACLLLTTGCLLASLACLRNLREGTFLSGARSLGAITTREEGVDIDDILEESPLGSLFLAYGHLFASIKLDERVIIDTPHHRLLLLILLRQSNCICIEAGAA